MALDITPITIIIPAPKYITASGLANLFISFPHTLRTFTAPLSTPSIDSLSTISIKPLAKMSDARHGWGRLDDRMILYKTNSTLQALTNSNHPDQMLTIKAASIGILERMPVLLNIHQTMLSNPSSSG